LRHFSGKKTPELFLSEIETLFPKNIRNFFKKKSKEDQKYFFSKKLGTFFQKKFKLFPPEKMGNSFGKCDRLMM
jgi:hypothetical protein